MAGPPRACPSIGIMLSVLANESDGIIQSGPDNLPAEVIGAVETKAEVIGAPRDTGGCERRR